MADDLTGATHTGATRCTGSRNRRWAFALLCVVLLTGCGEDESAVKTFTPWDSQVKSKAQAEQKRDGILPVSHAASAPLPTPTPSTVWNSPLAQKIPGRAVHPTAYGRPMLYGDRELRMFRDPHRESLELVDYKLVQLRIVGTSWTQLAFDDIRENGRIAIARIPDSTDTPLSITLTTQNSPQSSFSMVLLNVTERWCNANVVDETSESLARMRTLSTTNVPLFREEATRMALRLDTAERIAPADTAESTVTRCLLLMANRIAQAKTGDDRSPEFRHLKTIIDLISHGDIDEAARQSYE